MPKSNEPIMIKEVNNFAVGKLQVNQVAQLRIIEDYTIIKK
jgi:hypothetical protein